MKDDAAIDLVVERLGLPLLFVEIKSSSKVQAEDLSTLRKLAHDIQHADAMCFSQDDYSKQFDSLLVLPWQEGIRKYFTTVGI